MTSYLLYDRAARENLVNASVRLELTRAFTTRDTRRGLDFNAMLESVREYPDVLEVVGGAQEFDRILNPGRMLWKEFQQRREKNPFVRFAIVPYAENAQETLAYGCEVMGYFPKCTVDGTDFGRQHSLFSPAWLKASRKKFPHLTVRYRKGSERANGLRCEIIDLYPARRNLLEAAHMGVLFAYEQCGCWEFSRSSYWQDHIAGGACGVPPLTLGLEALTKCLIVKVAGQPTELIPSSDGDWHPLRLRMGATRRGEYLSFGFPFGDEDEQYARPVIVKATA